MPQQSPIPDDIDRPFWEACNEDHLVLQYCPACEKFRFPPAPECWVCGSTSLQWRDVAPTGTLYSYSVVHDTPVTVLKPDLPYVVGVIDIDGANGVNVVAHFPDVPIDNVPIDAHVSIVFEPTPGTGQKVPVGRITEHAAQ